MERGADNERHLLILPASASKTGIGITFVGTLRPPEVYTKYPGLLGNRHVEACFEHDFEHDLTLSAIAFTRSALSR